MIGKLSSQQLAQSPGGYLFEVTGSADRLQAISPALETTEG